MVHVEPCDARIPGAKKEAQLKDPPFRPVKHLDQQLRVHTIASVPQSVNALRLRVPLERSSALSWKVR